jgi:hypothetical protein
MDRFRFSEPGEDGEAFLNQSRRYRRRRCYRPLLLRTGRYELLLLLLMIDIWQE